MNNRVAKCRSVLGLFLFVAILAGRIAMPAPTDPWTETETVRPAQLAAELQLEKDPHPLVIYVGLKVLYQGAHIPGAKYFGAAGTEEGIAALKKYAATL